MNQNIRRRKRSWCNWGKGMQFVRGIGENGRIASPVVVQVRNRMLRNTYGEVWNPFELYSTIIFFPNLLILLFEEMLLRVLIFTSEQTV